MSLSRRAKAIRSLAAPTATGLLLTGCTAESGASEVVNQGYAPDDRTIQT